MFDVPNSFPNAFAVFRSASKMNAFICKKALRVIIIHIMAEMARPTTR